MVGASGPPAAARAPGASVLVVDDSRFVRASLVRGLTGRFRIQQAESGERAWELLLLDDSIGVVLSDLSMPGIDGFELLRRVRGSMLERVRELPFAMLSGSDDAAQRERALAFGADRFVVKGDGVGELADWIEARLTAAREAAAHAPTPVDVRTAEADAPRAPTAAAAEHRAVVPVPPAAPALPAGSMTRDAPALPNGAIPAPAAPTAVAAVVPAQPAIAAVPVAPIPVPASGGEAALAVGPGGSAAPRVARLVPDPVPRWFAAAAGRPVAAGEAAPALIRMHAPGLDDLPARLRRGVRAADALFVESADTAWLCVPATAAMALRLSLRFGLLAAGRQAHAPGGAAARVSMCMHPVDPLLPGPGLAALLAAPPQPPAGGGLAVRAFAGAWGPAWQCALPWPAVRLLAT
jgi:CheY-like chemotaxis protein